MASALTHLSNDSLLSGIKELVHSERRLTTEIIHHLREIMRRDLHLKLGYNSLFTYMVEELKYCEGSAHRRISAMNLLNSIPHVEAKKVEEKINSGKMSLTTVAMVQDLVRHKKKEKAPMSVSEKLKVLQSIEGLSKRETEKVLIAIAPELVNTKEKERVLTAEHTEIKIVLDEKTLAKLKRIKALRSHVNANPSYSELIDDMADQLLKKLDPLCNYSKHNNLDSDTPEVSASYTGSRGMDASRRSRPKAAQGSASVVDAISDGVTLPNSYKARQGRLALVDSVTTGAKRRESFRPMAAQGRITNSQTSPELMLLGSLNKLRSRYIPTKLRRSIWQGNHAHRSYKNLQTGKTCNSTHLLQIEHRIPFAKNGATTPENLTLLCANHNQMQARVEGVLCQK